uniref:Fe2OG dioxygenase domain-containing protein n=1 Tax=Acrobeloides nanus TaxID=290746 RepID=A0A914BVJ8_9BILA
MEDEELELATKAMEAHKEFVKQPLEEKKECVSKLTYSGYIASGEESTADKKDLAEIFTVCKDVPLDDDRVKMNWPCHGPTPWPNECYKELMTAYMDQLAVYGDKLLKLIALGLELPMNTFVKLVEDGWHHMRVLHFRERLDRQDDARGIGAHTDYGMLVIAAQDEVGGLFIRPPLPEWRSKNWCHTESAAGVYENDDGWFFVPPKEGTLTCFPGDMFQFLTSGFFLATPHKVRLNYRERFALAYFHEPNFNSVIRPLRDPQNDECIHYGTHFTNMFMRCYPDRVTTKCIEEENRLDILDKLRNNAIRAAKKGMKNTISCDEGA